MKHTVIEISDLSLPELDIFARLTEAQLRSRLEPEKGIFIAESPKVIARALDAGCQPFGLSDGAPASGRTGKRTVGALRRDPCLYCRPGGAGETDRL